MKLIRNLSAALLMAAVLPVTAQTGFPAFPPDSLAKNQCKMQMLHQLGIRLPSLPSTPADPNRPEGTTARYPDYLSDNPYGWTDTEAYGAGSPRNLYFFRTDWGLWTNYKEALIGDYKPMDLLKATDGTRIDTPEQWWKKRRPELMRMCESELWGRVPEAVSGFDIRWSATETTVADGPSGECVCKEITGVIAAKRSGAKVKHLPQLKARLYLPKGAVKAPVMIHIGECRPEFRQAFFAKGWGYMEFEHQALQPDKDTSLNDYLIGLAANGGWRRPDDWGTLRAWAWGVSRLIDYLEAEEKAAVDTGRYGVIGFSRLGKTAVVAGACEPRISVVYACCAGRLGVAPARRHYGEELEFIPYYWFAGNMMKYCGALHEGSYYPRRVALLPVDAEAFLGLLAPKALFITSGASDLWNDPKGALVSARAATPVYELLGAKGLVMKEAEPRLNTIYAGGRMVFHYHEGLHTYTKASLPAFVDLAEKMFDSVRSRK